MSIRLTLALLSLCLMMPLTVTAQDMPEPIVDRIIVEYPSLLPEGIEYDPGENRFLLGSGAFTNGSIFSVEPDGTISLLIEEDNLTMTLGLHIDYASNRLLAVNMDPALMMGEMPDFSLMGLAAYDLETLEQLFFVSLAPLAQENGIILVNDVTVDEDGNAYVTDSASPTIYKVTPDGTASVFVRDDRLQSPTIDDQNPVTAMNGIDYHPDGYLLVAVLPGDIYRVPLASPTDLSKVEIGMNVGIDGMVLVDENRLVAAAILGDIADPNNADFYIVEITSTDDWESATLSQQLQVEEPVTTVTVIDDTIYGIQPQFTNPMNEEYTILAVEFDPEE